MLPDPGSSCGRSLPRCCLKFTAILPAKGNNAGGQDSGCTAVAVIHTFAARSLRARRSHSGLRPETRSPARHRARLVQLTHRQGHELAHLVELRPGTGAAPARGSKPEPQKIPSHHLRTWGPVENGKNRTLSLRGLNSFPKVNLFVYLFICCFVAL